LEVVFRWLEEDFRQLEAAFRCFCKNPEGLRFPPDLSGSDSYISNHSTVILPVPVVLDAGVGIINDFIVLPDEVFVVDQIGCGIHTEEH
jgi:hypothetical protein